MAETLLVSPPAAAVAPPRRLSFPALVGLTHLAFAHQFLWTALLVLIVPAQVVAISGEKNKDTALASVLVGGALMAALTQVYAGWLSDRSTSRFGRRRPFIVGGTLIALLALYIMGTARSIPVLAVSYLLLQLGFNIGQAAYQAVIPDRVTGAQRGGASGLLAFLGILGAMAAALVAGALVKDGDFVSFQRVYIIIIGLNLVLTATTVLVLREQPLQRPERPARPMPLRPRTSVAASWRRLRAAVAASPDFSWVFITRFLMMMGYWTVLTFLLYYVRDALGAANATHAVALITEAVAVASAFGAFCGGYISDRLGRKPLVYASAGMVAVVSLAFIVTHTLGMALLVGALWGLGWGVFLGVDWALATDVLPRPEREGDASSFARYMGIWSLAVTLPQVLAPAIGPLIGAANAHARGSGYTLMFCVVCVYFVLGALLVRNVRSAR